MIQVEQTLQRKAFAEIPDNNSQFLVADFPLAYSGDIAGFHYPKNLYIAGSK